MSNEPRVVMDAKFNGKVLTARLAGNLTHENAPKAKDEFTLLLDTHKLTEISLDLSQTLHMDSAGLAVLISTRRSLGREGKMSLTSLLPEIYRLIDVMRLRGMFHCERSDGASGTKPAQGDGKPV